MIGDWILRGVACLAVVIALGCGAAADAQTPRRAGQVFDDCNGASWCPRMVVVPAGSFTMGSPETEDGRQANEGPQRRVDVARFAVGKFEITWDQWQVCVNAGACRAPDDAGFGRGNRPVINVSWNAARNYVAWLSRETGQPYRLLTEAEWEYAARAGTDTRFPWHDDASHEFANYGTDECCDGAVMGRDQWLTTAPVGSFPANAFGLYDMHGNVWELVQDCYVASYDGAQADEAHCQERIFRGGSWSSYPRGLRSAMRNTMVPTDHVESVGLRVARTLN